MLCAIMQGKTVLAGSSRRLGLMCPVRDLPWPVSRPLTQYSLSKSESPDHKCSRKAA